jgi:glycosyltransferase involved in cell wall biosynthesis
MNICIVSYGSISYYKKKAYTNPAITSILNHLAEVDNIRYIAPVADNNSSVWDKNKPVYKLNISDKVKTVGVKSIATGNSIQKILGILKNTIIIAKNIGSSDFAYIYMPSYSNLVACVLCIFMRIKYSLYVGLDWTIRKNAITKNPIYDFFYKKVYSMVIDIIYYRARFILVTGEKIFNEVSDANRKVFLTIPSVSFKNYKGGKGDSEFNMKNRCINLFFSGPINQRKGIIYLIKALSILIGKGINLHLYMAGTIDKSYKVILDREINLTKLSQFITFYGYVADKKVLKEMYSKSDIFVVSSLAEGFPRAIYEAMMLNIPVICSDIPSIRQSIEDSDTVYFVPPQDPEAIANAILTLVDNPVRCKRMVAKGLNFVKRKVPKEEHYEQIKKLIEKYA